MLFFPHRLEFGTRRGGGGDDGDDLTGDKNVLPPRLKVCSESFLVTKLQFSFLFETFIMDCYSRVT